MSGFVALFILLSFNNDTCTLIEENYALSAN
jgi:hypothetical protein